MVTVRYKGYWVFVLLARGDFQPSKFSPVAEISIRQNSNPLARLHTSDSMITEEDGLISGFQLATQWIDETLPQLCNRRKEDADVHQLPSKKLDTEPFPQAVSSCWQA